jgi:hypothetical protein
MSRSPCTDKKIKIRDNNSLKGNVRGNTLHPVPLTYRRPAKAGVQKAALLLDSGFCRKDIGSLSQQHSR